MMNLSSDALTTLVGVMADISALQRKAKDSEGVTCDVDLVLSGDEIDISVTVSLYSKLETSSTTVEPPV